MMKAAIIHTFAGIEKISLEEVMIPMPQDYEVQIAIKYAGVNPVDWKIAEGYLQTRLHYEFPIILGWDAAGVISKVGKEVKEFEIGDSVFAYCRKGILRDGSFADYICLPTENVVKKPERLNFSQAASIPLSALTAWQSLYDCVHLQPKETILIHAGAGGVGSFAIQLAKFTGAHVITTTSEANYDYVKALGADQVIDYRKESFIDSIFQKYPEGVDVVLDTVGGKTLLESYQVIKKNGRLVTIAGIIDQTLAARYSIQAEFVFVRPNSRELQQIAELIDERQITSPHIQEVPFEEIPLALRKSREGHTKGKLVIVINK